MLALVGSPSCILRSLLVCCCLRRYSSVNIPVGFVHYMVNASKLSVWTPPLSPHASPIPPPLFCNDSLEILWFPVVHFLSYPAYKQIEKRGGWCWDRSGGRGGGTEEAVVVVVVVVLGNSFNVVSECVICCVSPLWPIYSITETCSNSSLSNKKACFFTCCCHDHNDTAHWFIHRACPNCKNSAACWYHWQGRSQ